MNLTEAKIIINEMCNRGTAVNCSEEEKAYWESHGYRDEVQRENVKLARERDEALKEIEDMYVILEEERARSLRLAKEAIEERRWKEAWYSIAKGAITVPRNLNESLEEITKRWQLFEREAKRMFEEGK